MKPRRNKFQIVTDILKIVTHYKKIKMSHLMTKANLSSKNTQKYFKILKHKGIITDSKEGRYRFIILKNSHF